MSEAPKRPLAHASLSGSFILVATTGFACLLFSLLCTTTGWLSEDDQPVALIPQSTAAPEWGREMVHDWQSLKMAASHIEQRNLHESNKLLHERQLAHGLQRSFGAKFSEKLRSMIGADRIDNLKLVRLYLDYEGHYIEKSELSAQQRIHATLSWLQASRHDLFESNISDWMVGLHSRLIGASDIVYNKDYNLVSMIPDSRRLQCQSASVAMALAAMMKPIPTVWRPVFIHSHGHVQFGILSGQDIYIVEGTSLRTEVLRYPVAKLQGRQVTDARLTLLESMTAQASLVEEWRTSRWMSLLELFNHTAQAAELSGVIRETVHGPPLSRSVGRGPLVQAGDRKRSAVGLPSPSGMMRPISVTSSVGSSLRDENPTNALQGAATSTSRNDTRRGYGSRLVGRVGILQRSEEKDSAAFNTRRPKIHIGNISGATSGGERFAESVRSSILHHRRHIEKCYQQALLQSPHLTGKLVLHVTFNPHMETPERVAVESLITRVEFKDCVSNIATNVTSPVRSKKKVALRLPIFFNSVPTIPSKRRF